MGLDSVELVMAWGEEFGVSVSDGDVETLETPRMAVELIERLLEEDGRGVEREALERAMAAIVIEQLGIEPGAYHLDASFVRDLGVD